MTKKSENFLGKGVKFKNKFTEYEKFPEMGNLKQREMPHCLWGMDAPVDWISLESISERSRFNRLIMKCCAH